MTTNIFTVIFFDYGIYHDNKYRLEKIINKYNLKWNETKVVNLSPEDVLGIYTVFGHRDTIANDVNLNGRIGKSEIWETFSNAIKIIRIAKRTENEKLPVLMIYKGFENSFHEEFIRQCIGIGCVLSKVSESDGRFEEVFRKRKLDSEIVERFKNHEGTKEVIHDNFIDKIRQMGNEFCISFVDEWIGLIEKHGHYYDKDLLNEIEKINIKNE